MSASQKHWFRPQVVVLGRGMPEERVLSHCKHRDHPIGPESAQQVDCGKQGANNCSNCSDRGSPS